MSAKKQSTLLGLWSKTNKKNGGEILPGGSKRNLEELDYPEAKKSKCAEEIVEQQLDKFLEPTRDLAAEKQGKNCLTFLKKPEDIEDFIKQNFLVEMPIDFYRFWEFCKGINSKNPADALSKFGLKLVGAFDVLSSKVPGNLDPSQYLIHWRYYYDPPEFQTVIKGDDKTQYHMGYFRDDPNDMPAFVGSNVGSKGPAISILGDNLFAAVSLYLGNSANCPGVPRVEVDFARKKLLEYAKKFAFPLDVKTQRVKDRQKKVVGKPFHGAGLVVPYDKKTSIGYREIPETAASLKKMFQRISDAKTPSDRTARMDAIQQLITNVQFANDEGDPGMGIELGLDMFCFGSDIFHSHIHHLLCLGYSLVNKKPFGEILKAHLANRRKESDLSTVC